MPSKTFVVGNKDVSQRVLFSDMLKSSLEKTIRDLPDLAVLSAVATGAVFLFQTGAPTLIDVAQHAGVATVGMTALDFGAHMINKFRKTHKTSTASKPAP